MHDEAFPLKPDDPAVIRQSSKEIAATWLALGLVFYFGFSRKNSVLARRH